MSAIQLDIHSSLALPSSRTRIPQIGFGVYESPPDKCFNSCSKALEAGYRHIDTAQYYKNEADVGRAIRESNVARKDVHITTKILEAGKDLQSTYEKILESVQKLDGKDGYVDLFLIHSPNSGKEGRRLMWQALEKAKIAGKVREIGVSNYGVGHIEEIRSYSEDWPPAVNQIELHPWCQQVECVKYCQQHGIVVEAYCPLVRNEKAEDPTLVSISNALRVEPSQVLIRWSLQKRFVPLPKSDTPSRIISNVDVYNFSLSKHHMDSLDRLDQGKEGCLVAVVDNREQD